MPERAGKLLPGKTFATLKEQRLPRKLAHQIREIATGRFLDDASNVLCFGLPGRGRVTSLRGSDTRW